MSPIIDQHPSNDVQHANTFKQLTIVSREQSPRANILCRADRIISTADQRPPRLEAYATLLPPHYFRRRV